MRMLVPLLLASALLQAAPMTDGERTRLLAHLEMTESWLASELKGLSPAQLSFRPAPGKWSILDVLEHLTLAEPQYWKQLKEAAARPPDPQKSPATDEDILWYGIDRSRRATTGEPRTSKGQLKDAKAGLDAVLKLRLEIKEYARTTNDDLRARPLQKGAVDCYQWALMISSHSMRHILQIREIKTDPAFPSR